MPFNKFTTIIILGITASLMFGCASSLNSTSGKEVSGNTIDIAQLSGSWKGKYVSTVTQRSGTITLDLSKETNKAVGQVFLTSFVTTKKTSSSNGSTNNSTVVTPQIKPLPVEFIAVKNGTVNGSVTPYADPRFGGKTVFTSFEGTLSGNKMEGTFTSRIGQNGNSYNGSWWAVRK
jgi:hypothetical protein